MGAAKREPPTSARAGTECRRGAMIGAANGLVMAAIVGATPPVAALAAASAAAVGALIALLIWSASSAVEEDRIEPPRDNS